MAFNKWMHPENPYRKPPDFKALAIKYPEFRKFITQDIRHMGKHTTYCWPLKILYHPRICGNNLLVFWRRNYFISSSASINPVF